MLLNRGAGVGGDISVAAPMARVAVSPMSEMTMNNERRIVFILEDYVAVPFAGLILNGKSERQVRGDNHFARIFRVRWLEVTLANRSESRISHVSARSRFAVATLSIDHIENGTQSVSKASVC